MRSLLSFILGTLLSLFCIGEASAIELTDRAGPVAIDQIRYIEDATGALESDEALDTLRRDDGSSISVTGDFDVGNMRSHYWLYFKLVNRSGKPGPWRIIASAGTRKRLDISVYSDEGVTNVLNASESQPFGDRHTDFRMLSSDTFDIDTDCYVEVLVEYHVNGPSRLPLYIDSDGGFIDRTHLDDVSSALFYCFSLTVIAIFLLFAVAARHRVAMLYAVMFAIGLLYIAANEGFAFEYLWPQSPSWNARSALVLSYAFVSFGFAVAHFAVSRVAAGTLSVHVPTVAAVITAGLMIFTVYIQAEALYDIAMALMVMMLVVQAWALAGWASSGRLREHINVVVTGLLALLVAVLATSAIIPGLLPEFIYMNAYRMIFLLTMLSVMAIIATHIRGMHDDHELSLHRELEATRREAETSKALLETEKNYARARQLAELHRDQLATASHDMRQPLVSLRATLDVITDDQPEETRLQLQRAFDYLENICRKSMRGAGSSPGDDLPMPDETGDEPGEQSEPYDVSIVIETALRMFEEEARINEIDIESHSIEACTDVPPMVLMRILSNLLSNAIKHSRAGRILLAARHKDGRIQLEVHDTGPGMDEATLERVQQAYQKGPDSSGEGLGLAICHQLAEQCELDLVIHSVPDHGTCCRLTIPSVNC